MLNIDWDNLNWGNPIIKEADVLSITTDDLCAVYESASDLNKGNLFFVLLASFFDYTEQEKQEAAAHLSFLIAFYLFMIHTPPGSQALAMHYIKQAVALNPADQYKAWVSLIEKGN